jgi:beta-lactam-binding protein with PASTA domain/predicted Ser/Thr protein kinase
LSAPLATDTRVAGRYRLLYRLGAGGMADVWAAEDSMLGRRVALKFLLPRYAEDEQFVERFRREAAAAAGLQHPNVVSVYDRGEHEGVPFIAMEYVEGASLKDLIERGLTVGEAVEITRQVLAGARFAHSKGIIHRDLKPQNVLVDAEGRARVADFGIARAGTSEITQTGSVLGTAQYLSPEQAQGLPVTAASDLYSVGAMLYEALTGEVPFDADSPVAVALKQVSEQPRAPSQLNPQVPRALDAVVLRALAKDPANRFASADEFLRALEQAEADPSGGSLGDTASYAAAAEAAAPAPAAAPATPPPTGPPPAEEEGGFWNRRRAIAAALIALLLAGGIIAFLLTRGGTTKVPVPKVTGELLQQATRVLERKGFDVEPSNTPSNAPVNEVVEQDPRPGVVADKGSTVTLSVSTGPGVGTVPGVVGKPVDDAIKLLRRRGFEAVVRHRYARAAHGTVVSQSPPANAHRSRSTSVTIEVSRGQHLVAVPSVVAEQQATAETDLRNAGFKANVTRQSSTEPSGQVISQDPAAGSTVGFGSTVTITVSTGVVIVPNVVGELEAEAIRDIQAQGIAKVKVIHQATTTRSEDGRVVQQAPTAGARIPSTDSVTIFVGSFRETTTGTTTTTTTTTPTVPTTGSTGTTPTG